MSRTPWDAVLRAARRLGLAPDAVWRLSLREWRALTAPDGPAPLGRDAFERLRAAHPDDGEP